MRSYRNKGRRVIDPDGNRFATAADPLAALLICVSLNHRNHRPGIDGGHVVCSRCQNRLPEDAAEPCVPRTPRCSETPDMFSEEARPADPVKETRAA